MRENTFSEERVVSVTCDDTGKIVYANALATIFDSTVIRFRPVQHYVVASDDGTTLIWDSEENDELPCGIPRNVAYITWDNKVVRNGYTYLGYGKSILTVEYGKSMHHVANPLGEVRVFLDEEFYELVEETRYSEENMLSYYDYEANCGTDLISYLSNPRYFAKQDFGWQEPGWLAMVGLSIEHGFGYSDDIRSSFCVKEQAVMSIISLNNNNDVLLLPDTIKNPWVALSSTAPEEVRGLSLIFPRAVNSFGISAKRDTIRGITFPEKVFRDVFINIESLDIAMEQWVIPTYGNTYVSIRGLSGLKTLELRADKDRPALQSNLFIHLAGCNLDELIFDFDETVQVLYLYCDDIVKHITIRTKQHGVIPLSVVRPKEPAKTTTIEQLAQDGVFTAFCSITIGEKCDVVGQSLTELHPRVVRC